jgi:antitoxin component of MazEF toxin-antitoxin module
MNTAKSKVSQYGDSKVIRIPQSLFLDSNFPFQIGEEIVVSINEGKLIISRDGK